jgi:O-antigen/teichoic acid export membrane protein
VGGNAALYLAFHHKYSTVSLTLFPISLGMAMYSIYLVLETWVVSIGRPTLHALSMSLIAAMTLGGDLVLIPMYGQVGAGAAFLIGMTAGLLTLSVAAWATRPARRAQAAVHSPHVA